MRFNPCGFAVDVGRRPYRVKMRIWDSPDAPLADVYYYRTTLPFLPFPTLFASRDYTDRPWPQDVLGEQWWSPRPYDGLESIPGLTGDHFCGTPQDFEFGPTWPPVGPELEYDADGIPTCCNRTQEPNVCSCSQPNALVSFSAPAYATSGGYALGGHARYTPLTPYATSGGYALGGHSRYTPLTPYATSGGFALGGTATVLGPDVYATSGGFALGGTATVLGPDVYATSGGFALGGTATVLGPDVYATSGGFALGGTATVLGPDVYATSGGFALGGTATVPSGPGPTCETALDMTDSVPYTGPIDTTAEQWFHLYAPSGTTITATIGAPATLVASQLYQGTCAGLVLLTNGLGPVVLTVPGRTTPLDFYVRLLTTAFPTTFTLTMHCA